MVVFSLGTFDTGVEGTEEVEGGLVVSKIPGIIPASAEAWKSGDTRFWMKES